MKLVLLYGPPAVGKLTVAQALVRETSFKILHNHLVSDLVVSVFERGSPPATDLNYQLRRQIYEAAAKNGVEGIVSTVTYRYNIKEQMHEAMRGFRSIMEKHGGEFCVVRLSCDIETLKRRVEDPSRKETNKVSSVEKLMDVLEKEGLDRAMPESVVPGFHVENTSLTPDEAAQRIIERFSL